MRGEGVRKGRGGKEQEKKLLLRKPQMRASKKRKEKIMKREKNRLHVSLYKKITFKSPPIFFPLTFKAHTNRVQGAFTREPNTKTLAPRASARSSMRRDRV